MRARLLGRVEAEIGGIALPLGGPKQRAVFALLALEVGRVVPLDRLVDELWRDEPPAQATLSLQSYVSRLRRVLGGDPSAGVSPPRIVTRPPGWLLDLPPEDVDVVQFNSLVAEGRALLSEGRPDAAARRVSDALGLWTGPAMGDLDVGHFAAVERERLEQLRLDATELLVEAQLAAGEPAAAAQLGRRFVTENPFRERGWVLLMSALYRTGRQAEALSAAAQVRQMLAEELGLDPSPEVRELETRILRQDPSLDGSLLTGSSSSMASGPSVSLAVPAEAGAVDGRLGDGRDLIAGRAEVFAIVDEMLVEAALGRGRVMLVEGAAGIGKTTVLRAVEDRAAGDGVVVHGVGVAGGAGGPAFWPWVMIVRELLGKLPGLASARFLDDLAMIDPGLSAQPLTSKPEADPAMNRTRLYRAVIDLLGLARDLGPLTVVIDDAQWLDDQTWNLLAVAVPELTARGVFFALAIRSEESSVGGDPVMILDGTPRELVRRLPLRGLTKEETAQVIDAVAGAPVDAAVSDAISTRTNGNPLFVTELTRLLVSERRLDPAAVYTFLPDEVRGVLRRRLDRLPETTLTVLVVVAVLGRPVDVGLLAAVTGMDTASVLDACESALLVEVLVDGGAAPGAFTLSHDMVRQTLVESVTATRLIRLHARIGQALTSGQTHTPDQVIEIAHHLRLAAPVLGPALAVPFHISAADDALRRLAFEQADQILTDTLALVGQIADPAERTAFERQARGRLALVRIYSKGTIETRELLEVDPEQATLTLDLADPTTWWADMTTLLALGGYNRMVIEAEAALAADLPAAVDAMVHLELGLALFFLGNFDRARVELSATQTLLAQGTVLESVVSALSSGSVTNLLGMIAHFRGDEPGADLLLAQALQQAGDAPQALVIAEFGNAWLAASRGDPAVCAEHAQVCADIGSRFGYAAYVAMGKILAGWAAAMTGDPTGAQVADDAYAGYRVDGSVMLTTVFLTLRAEAHARTGRIDLARELVAEADTIAAQTGERSRGPRLTALTATLTG